MARREKQGLPAKPFKGALAEPIPRERKPLSLFAEPPRVIELDLAGLVAWFGKMELLADHYGVKTSGPAGRGFMSALHLARDFAPGFKFADETEPKAGG